MSEAYLIVAVIATFAAVMLGGIAVEITVAEKRRAVEVFETQVGHLAANLRQEDLRRSFVERVLFPFLRALGGAARRVTPLDMRRKIDKKLVLAGSPAGWDAEKVAAFKLIGLALGGGLAWMIGMGSGATRGTVLLMTLLFAAIGYFGPDAVVGGRAQRRQEHVRRALPDSMDLLTISVEAGLGFDAAMAQVVRNVPGPLSHEFGRMLQEMQLGMSREDAFRKLADRTEVDELKAFVISMIQANKFGVGVANVLRAQAKELRLKRKQRAERKAMQTPVKILFPLIFCVLPALFVVVMGPGAIRIFSSFFG
jgi:tight adherence protein C